MHTLLPTLYEQTLAHTEGEVADYIPQLADVNPELFAVSFCDLHGKTTNLGDHTYAFCLQSCCKPLNYCLARQLEADTSNVHKHVGYEPSGRAFNEFVLNHDGLPHNPLINAGAIMVASLLHPADEPSTRFNAVKDFYQQLSGHSGAIGFDNGVYLSEKHHADRNISLAYYMRENHAFDGYPTPSQLQDHLDLYYQCCSVTVTSELGAVMAATLANRGVCPLNDERVVEPDVVKDALSIMYGCGMYDFSGQFAFQVGLPAKSGVSGCVLLVVPNVGGVCVWSPRLDRMGNSVRALAFCKALTDATHGRYHLFGRLMCGQVHDAYDTTTTPSETTSIHRVISYASRGNVEALRSVQDDQLLHGADYDGRTALHLACAEGHVEVVRLLVERGVPLQPKDRWGNTPAHEASKRRKHLQQALDSAQQQADHGDDDDNSEAVQKLHTALVRVRELVDVLGVEASSVGSGRSGGA